MRINARLATLTIAAVTGLAAPLALAPSAGAGVVTCFGQAATITGTPDGETIEGTPENDVIVGLGGDDTIFGKGGNDRICGASDDVIVVENDTLFGGPGNDLLRGTESPSSLISGWASGGKGADHFLDTAVTYEDAPRGVNVDLEEGAATGWGADTLENVVYLRGSSHDDELLGNKDKVVGGDCGCDEVFGRGGDDVIRGFAGWDDLYGGKGDDDLYGGRGDDELFPHRGSDRVFAGKGADSDDTVSYRDIGGNDAVVVDIREGLATGVGHDRLFHIDSAEGTRYADELWGDGDPNDLIGGEGPDELHGRAGSDRLFGGLGNDKLFGGKGNDFVRGDEGSHDVCRSPNPAPQQGCED